MYKGSLEEKTALRDYFELMYSVNTREKIKYFDKKAQTAYGKASKVLNGQSREYLNAINGARYLNLVKKRESIMAVFPHLSQLEALKEINAADGLVKKVLRELAPLFPANNLPI